MPKREGCIFLLGVVYACIISQLLSACALEPDYDDPPSFCERAMECWEACDGELWCETECKWEWPNDWQQECGMTE